MIRGSIPRPPVPSQPTDPAQGLEPLTVRVSTAVKLTGISRSRLYELIQSGDLETRKVGRSTLIPFPALKRLVGAARKE
jgi:excisionase family DNA binding protein